MRLRAPAPSARTGNPVADAVRAAMHRHDLPAPLLLDMIDAREVDLALHEPTPTTPRSPLTCGKARARCSPWPRASCVPSASADAQAAAAASGQAYGLARLLLGLPHALARGRVPLPQSRLDACAVSNQALLSGEGGSNVAALIASLCAEARKALATSREQVANLPRQVRPAFLPLALVEPYLRALERPGRDVLRSVAEIAPLTRVWRIAAAHWLGRI